MKLDFYMFRFMKDHGVRISDIEFIMVEENEDLFEVTKTNFFFMANRYKLGENLKSVCLCGKEFYISFKKDKLFYFNIKLEKPSKKIKLTKFKWRING